MATRQIREILWESILGGKSPLKYYSSPSEFYSSIGIDPDMPVDLGSSDIVAGGMITPVGFQKFSSTEMDGTPIAIITEPKIDKVYVITSAGHIVSYSTTLASETSVGTVAGGNCEGAEYYNNYIYLFGTGSSHNDVSRLGPLDGTPSLTDAFWTSTLSLTALGDETYPSVAISSPKHWAHAHSDNKLYFGDFIAGQGHIHAIKTTKSTAEGDTDDGSAYDALASKLPIGMRPVDIESYGTDLAILCVQTTGSTFNQGRAALYLWDTTSENFYREIPIPAPLATALLNKNGELFVFCGNGNNGISVLHYLGAYSFEAYPYFSEGTSPPPGAVDSYGNRIAFGTTHVDPTSGPSIVSIGYKDARLPSRAVHNIGKVSSSGTTPIISAARYVQQASGSVPRLIVGWKDSTPAYGLDKINTAATGQVIRKLFNIGQKFRINKIRIPLSDSVAATTSIVTKIYYDGNLGNPATLTTINNTNFPGERNIVLSPPPESNFGHHDFFIELTFSCSVVRSIILPVYIEIELVED